MDKLQWDNPEWQEIPGVTGKTGDEHSWKGIIGAGTGGGGGELVAEQFRYVVDVG